MFHEWWKPLQDKLRLGTVEEGINCCELCLSLSRDDFHIPRTPVLTVCTQQPEHDMPYALRLN
jgi:hypothetical protein